MSGNVGAKVRRAVPRVQQTWELGAVDELFAQRELEHDYDSRAVKFDKLENWGHVVEPPNYWKTEMRKETMEPSWPSMECLTIKVSCLYHWVQYVNHSSSVRRSTAGHPFKWNSFYLLKTLHKTCKNLPPKHLSYATRMNSPSSRVLHAFGIK